jgi:uncharacterized protein
MIGAETEILARILLAAFGSLCTTRDCKDKLIIFTRFPKPGETKTRLIPLLGKGGAAALHRGMTTHIAEEAKSLAKTRPLAVEIRYDGGSEILMRDWLGPDYAYRHQGGGDLGQRMFFAFGEAFSEGMDRVVLVGTDIPGLNGTIIETAMQGLLGHDLVLGPAIDGGYYLIGFNRPPNRALFTGIPWGTGIVLASTLRIAKEHGLSTALVETLSDVDRPEDVELLGQSRSANAWKEHAESISRISARISVIIPTLNEESCLGDCLSSVMAIQDVEIVIVDGGSTDKTVEMAKRYGVKVLRGPKGRALQMNLGATHASGDILLFLHADTRLPECWANHVMHELDKPNTAAGAFGLRIEGRRPGLRFIEKLANVRSKKLQIPYGDQAIFIKAELFRRIGGFKDLPVMEDFELVQRLKRIGRIRTAPVAVFTSSRRWEKQGIWLTTAIHQAIIIAYMLGVPPKWLARLRQTSNAESASG